MDGTVEHDRRHERHQDRQQERQQQRNQNGAPTAIPVQRDRRWHPASWHGLPVAQRPPWPDQDELAEASRRLRELPALTTSRDVARLRARLAEVAAGRGFVLQGGDCAEPFGPEGVAAARARQTTLHELAGRLERWMGVPVVRVGRLAGQFGKPRSTATEVVDGRELPSYRGSIVNGPEPTEAARRADPRRLVAAYGAAADVMAELGRLPGPDRLWTSHEALVLEYEQALTRPNQDTGTWSLLSTHFPWLGERTRQLDGAHVEFLSGLDNPIGAKVGPTATPDDLVRLCERLDPHREPGRLTLIARLGAGQVAARLPPLVAAVRAAGHPVVWMCDPMHGNTIRTASGVKTRLVGDIAFEWAGFTEVLLEAGEWPGGVHLEIGDEDITECLGAGGPTDEAALPTAYRTLCDPRLSVPQAHQVLTEVRQLLPTPLTA
ncbi:3-deoxy-7-phosphoheptulonate synthase [Actinokineospora inagensis]|uniref:3-deoxy-7-phosphoheptulonate synthase n=1 Tax=Actinokineospora inagensis TaxID=103730 RepID=UPI000418C937|nr:3-deoxy-7-phosphoheptulonate synthase [Actinokineospora inagensis]